MCVGADGFPPHANNKKLEQVRRSGRMLFMLSVYESFRLKKVRGLLMQKSENKPNVFVTHIQRFIFFLDNESKASYSTLSFFAIFHR